MTSAPINRELAEKGVGALFEEGFKEEAEAINALLADHAAQAEEIERLQIDNDIKAGAVRDQQAQITAQAEIIKSLSELLTPFAVFGRVWVGPWSEIILKSDLAGVLTVGDLRRATDAIDRLNALDALSPVTGEQSQ